MWSNVLATSFDSNTEGHESRFSHSGVGRAHVDLELGREDGEDLLRGKGLSEGIKASERELVVSFGGLDWEFVAYPRWRVLLSILRIIFTPDG